MFLDGKYAIVTGASRGIGRATALALAGAGAAVMINYVRNDAAAEAVRDEITAAGGRAAIFKADVSMAEEASALVGAALKEFGRVDILVNNAGVTRDGLLMRMKEEDWDLVLNINLKGAFNTTKAVLRPMLKARAGRIIAISSIIGLRGNPGQANYAAAKAGLIGFMKTVAREVGSRGITANAVAPGFIDTEMTRGLSETVKEGMLAEIPLGRFGRPEDVAKLVCFLAGEDARYITGQVISVDGGLAI